MHRNKLNLDAQYRSTGRRSSHTEQGRRCAFPPGCAPPIKQKHMYRYVYMADSVGQDTHREVQRSARQASPRIDVDLITGTRIGSDRGRRQQLFVPEHHLPPSLRHRFRRVAGTAEGVGIPLGSPPRRGHGKGRTATFVGTTERAITRGTVDHVIPLIQHLHNAIRQRKICRGPTTAGSYTGPNRGNKSALVFLCHSMWLVRGGQSTCKGNRGGGGTVPSDTGRQTPRTFLVTLAMYANSGAVLLPL